MDDKKRITFLIGSLGGGGAENVCVTLANYLVSNGWEVDLLVLKLKGSIHRKRLAERVNLVCLDVDNTRFAFFKLRTYILKSKPGKFLVFNEHFAVLLLFLRSFLRANFSIFARNISTLSIKNKIEESFWQKYIVNALIGYFYRKVDLVISQSNGMKNDLIKNYGFDAAKIIKISNPLNSIIEENCLNAVNNEELRGNFILCVGRLEKEKGFNYAIEAFAKVAPMFPGLRLKFIGTGSLENHLDGIAEGLGVREKVDFEGFQENVIPYYRQASLTLLTSYYEGFPNVLIESIAMGTPVVAFDCSSGPSEIIVPEVNGILVDYLNSEALVTGLINALNKNWDRKVVAETARPYFSSKISQEYCDVLT